MLNYLFNGGQNLLYPDIMSDLLTKVMRGGIIVCKYVFWSITTCLEMELRKSFYENYITNGLVLFVN